MVEIKVLPFNCQFFKALQKEKKALQNVVLPN